jgi:hypothetical protein
MVPKYKSRPPVFSRGGFSSEAADKPLGISLFAVDFNAERFGFRLFLE